MGSFPGHQFIRRLIRMRVFGLVALAMLLLSACGGGASLPAGVYTNQQYGFRLTYPAGWQVNTSQQPGAAAPLIVIVTRSGARNTPGSAISSLTVDVLSLSDIGGTTVTAQLASDKTLSPVTLAGRAAYRDKPTQQQGNGALSAVSITHSDYYVVNGDYEYQISIDALAGDEATLDAMAQTFTFVQ